MRSKTNQNMMGILALVAAAGIYGGWGVLSRIIGTDFGIFHQYGIRYVIVFILSGALLWKSHDWKKLRRRDLGWIGAWAGASIIADILVYIAFNSISISLSYFLVFCGMVLSGIILGRVMYDEKFNKFKFISIILSLLGLYITFASNGLEGITIGMIIAFAGGLFAGGWNALSKKLSSTYPHGQLTFIYACISLIIYFLLGFVAHETLPQLAFSLPWLSILVLGISSVFTVRLVVYGYHYVEAQIGSLLNPLEVIFGTIYAFILFHEIPTPNAFFGGLCIIIAAILPNLYLENKKTL